MYSNGNGTHTNMSNGISAYEWLSEQPAQPDYPICPSDYPAVDAVPMTPSTKWRSEFPVYTHNVSWLDPEGVSHSLTLRSDDLQGLFADIKMLKGMIRRSKEKATAASPDAPDAPLEEPVTMCKIHHCAMERRQSKRTGGHYMAHRQGTSLCFGRAKK